MTLFNHSLHFSEPLYGRDPFSYHKLAAKGGFEYYETRAHGCTKPGDILQLDPDLREEYPHVAAHYRQVGLDCTEHVAWDLAAEVANDFPNEHLSVYLFVDAINKVRPNPKRLEATKTYLNKNSFIRLCQDIAPVPKTVFGDTRRTLADYSQLSFPLFVKGAYSSSGSSAYRCTNDREVAQAMQHMHGEYQIQEAVPIDALLSVQYDIASPDKVRHMLHTEQIIDGVEYVGTRFPTPYHPHTATHAIAHQAAKDGIRGKIGIDVAASHDGHYYVLECNPRWTGAIYPMVIAERLGAPSWSTIHLPVRAHSLKHVDLQDLQYSPQRKTGVVLVNWGVIKYGWLELLLIGSKRTQQTLHAQLAKTLS